MNSERAKLFLPYYKSQHRELHHLAESTNYSLDELMVRSFGIGNFIADVESDNSQWIGIVHIPDLRARHLHISIDDRRMLDELRGIKQGNFAKWMEDHNMFFGDPYETALVETSVENLESYKEQAEKRKMPLNQYNRLVLSIGTSVYLTTQLPEYALYHMIDGNTKLIDTTLKTFINPT